MATLFNRAFEFLRIGKSGFDSYGRAVAGEVSTRSVRGTVQPLNGKETVPAVAASRNTGRQRKSNSKEPDSAQSGRSSRKRSWSMSTRLGRKPTPTHNSTQKVHAPKRAVPRIRRVSEIGKY